MGSDKNETSWSRAFLASTGLAMARSEPSVHHESAEAREAMREGLARDRIIALSQAKDVRTKELIAEREDAPLGVLITLAHDAHAAVRIAVAANGAAVRAVLEHLAADRDGAVLKAVARNAATPRDIVEKLAFGRREEVRRVAARRLNEPFQGEPPPPPPAPQAPEIDERTWAEADPSHALGSPAERQRVLAPRPTVAPRVDRSDGLAMREEQSTPLAR